MRCPTCQRRLAFGARCPQHPDTKSLLGREPISHPPDLPGYSDFVWLGGGGFGDVFTARPRAGGEAVAIKVATAPDDLRFGREAEALRRLGGKFAPALLDAGRTRTGHPYLTMERLMGQSLADWLSAVPGAGVPPLDDACRVFAGLADAVESMHQAGVVHRDLKPENVFLREGAGCSDVSVALLDFGLARFAGEAASGTGSDLGLTRTSERLGTPWYMAPEQCLEARDADARADVYALGVMLFELLTGRIPFTGEGAEVVQAHLSRRPLRASVVASQHGATVPAAVDDVLLRCLAKEPAERFGRAEELHEALVEALRPPAEVFYSPPP